MMKASSASTSVQKIQKKRTDQLGFRSLLDHQRHRVLGFHRCPHASPRTQTCSKPFESPKEEPCRDRGFGVLWKVTAGSGSFLLKPHT